MTQSTTPNASGSVGKAPASPRVLLLVPVCIVVCAIVMTQGPYAELAEVSLSSGGVLDEAPRASAELVAAHLDSIGERGRELYASHRTWDLPFSIANVILLASILVVALPRAGAHRALCLLALSVPLAGGVLDVIENGLVGRAVAAFPSVDAGEAATLAWVTQAKIVAFGIGGLLAIGSLAAWGVRAAIRRTKRPAAAASA